MRNKIALALVTASLSILAPRLSHASSVPGNGTVVSISVANSNFATVSITNATGSAPGACPTLGAYGIDISTAQGKAMLSALDGAQLSGKRLGVGGSTTCTGGAETLGLLTVFTN